MIALHLWVQNERGQAKNLSIALTLPDREWEMWSEPIFGSHNSKRAVSTYLDSMHVWHIIYPNKEMCSSFLCCFFTRVWRIDFNQFLKQNKNNLQIWRL
jgi:hypothetical protein